MATTTAKTRGLVASADYTSASVEEGKRAINPPIVRRRSALRK